MFHGVGRSLKRIRTEGSDNARDADLFATRRTSQCHSVPRTSIVNGTIQGAVADSNEDSL